MSLYSRASKEIGWDDREMIYPSLQEIVDLVDTAKYDFDSFKKLFAYHRFLKSPATAEQEDVIKLIHFHFNKIRDFYS